MDENKEVPEEKEQEEPTGDSEDGAQSPSTDEIDRINAETERIHKAIAEKKNAEARAKLAGVTDAGTQPQQLSREDKAREKTKDFFKGTPVEKALEKNE